MENLIRVIAEISGGKKEDITPDLDLNQLKVNSSIGILKLQSALEKEYNTKLKPLSLKMKVGMIAEQLGLGGNGSLGQDKKSKKIEKKTKEAPKAIQYYPNSIDIFVGVDIEEVESLPKTSNFRTHSFYSSQYDDIELSYALLMTEPYTHLCGMFCAKEALKKSAPDLIDLSMKDIIVSHNSSKRPSIKIAIKEINKRYHFKISISHTEKYATAVVMAIDRKTSHK